jgi:hypothetical protein
MAGQIIQSDGAQIDIEIHMSIVHVRLLSRDHFDISLVRDNWCAPGGNKFSLRRNCVAVQIRVHTLADMMNVWAIILRASFLPEINKLQSLHEPR